MFECHKRRQERIAIEIDATINGSELLGEASGTIFREFTMKDKRVFAGENFDVPTHQHGTDNTSDCTMILLYRVWLGIVQN